MEARPNHEGPGPSPSFVSSRSEVSAPCSALSYPQPAIGKAQGRTVVFRGQRPCRVLLRAGDDDAPGAWATAEGCDFLPRGPDHGSAERLGRTPGSPLLAAFPHDGASGWMNDPAIESQVHLPRQQPWKLGIRSNAGQTNMGQTMEPAPFGAGFIGWCSSVELVAFGAGECGIRARAIAVGHLANFVSNVVRLVAACPARFFAGDGCEEDSQPDSDRDAADEAQGRSDPLAVAAQGRSRIGQAIRCVLVLIPCHTIFIFNHVAHVVSAILQLIIQCGPQFWITEDETKLHSQSGPPFRSTSFSECHSRFSFIRRSNYL